MSKRLTKPQFKQRLFGELEPGYTPNKRVKDFAKTVSIRAAVGVTAVGKDTLMRASGLHVVKGQTSRAQRPSEQDGPIYEFLDTSEKLELAIEDVVAGNFVQVIQHPTTGELYGTLERHFDNPLPGTACLMDVTAQEYVRIREENLFGGFEGICITAPVTEWHRRQEMRGDGIGEEERDQRAKEARSSLWTCLELIRDPRHDMQFVLNDDLDEAAEDMRRIASGRVLSLERHQLAREAGYLMLDSLLEPVS